MSNLLEIIAACEDDESSRVAASLTSYGQLKQRATDAVLAVLAPIRKRYDELAGCPEVVARIYAGGALRCREETAPVLAAAREAMGLS